MTFPSRFNGDTPPAVSRAQYIARGILLGAREQGTQNPSDPLNERELFLQQLQDDGYVEPHSHDFLLPWPSYYRLSASEDHKRSLHLLAVAPIENWRPTLESRGTLLDPTFSVVITSWTDQAGTRLRGNAEIVGALFRTGSRECILPERIWRTLEAIKALKSIPSESRGADDNRRAWGAIRDCALGAADLNDFLKKTIVLTPKKIRITLKRHRNGDHSSVEVIPTFDDAPPRWLEIFDRLKIVPERYDIPDGAGMIQVIPSPEVRTILREIRTMPKRHVSGERAEAFVRNPFATLGSDAASVIDPDQFESARIDAGISFCRFTAFVRRDTDSQIEEYGLLVEESVDNKILSDTVVFSIAADSRSLPREAKLQYSE
jgi:hypothetical protein